MHAYSTRVEKLTKEGSVWHLTSRHLKYLEESKRIKATWTTEDFDAIVIGTGPYDAPHVPEIDGLIQWSEVKADNPAGYSVYHSRAYRNPEPYAGKVRTTAICRDISWF